MSGMPEQSRLSFHTLGADHQLSAVGLVMLINMTALVLEGPAVDPRGHAQRVANEVASTIAAKGGYGVDTEEPGDVLLIDVDKVSWHDAQPLQHYVSDEEIRESVQARRDWMIPDLDVPESKLGELKDRYRTLVDRPSTPADTVRLLHDVAQALGWKAR